MKFFLQIIANEDLKHSAYLRLTSTDAMTAFKRISHNHRKRKIKLLRQLQQKAIIELRGEKLRSN